MGTLDGVRVLDLTRLLPGPFCTMIMADNGADVIKVEQPLIGDYGRESDPVINGISMRHLMVNRNKKSLTLDLKKVKAKKIFQELIKEFDVVVEGFRPGVMEKLGFSYKEMSEINPGIVCCSITGYGQTGPYRNLAGHDINYIGYSGVLGLIGERNGDPIIPGVQVADIGGGALMALSGIMMALYHKERSGKGQYVDISMMDGAISWLLAASASYFATQQPPERGKQRLSGNLACYAVYPTKDGKYLSVGALEGKFWHRLCQLIGKEELIEQQKASEEIQLQMKEELKTVFLQRSQREWLELLKEEETCVGPVYDLDEVFQDPQVLVREMLLESEHPILGVFKQLGFPIKFSDDPASLRLPAPELGQNNLEVLQELGYSEQQITNLEKDGVI